MSDHDNANDGTDDAIDRLGRAAGAELRRPPSQAALDRVATSGRRRRAMRTVTVSGLAVGAAAAIAAAAVVLRDSNETVSTDTTPPTAPSTQTTALTTPSAPSPRSTTSTATTEPTVETTAPPIEGPIEIGPSTEFVWGDGAVLGAYIDDRFVAFDIDAIAAGDAPAFVAPALPEPTEEAPQQEPVALLGRTGAPTPFDFHVFEEGCGAIIVSPAVTQFPDAPASGWLTTVGHPLATLDGAVSEQDSAALDAALIAAGLTDADREAIERITPTESIDSDPSLETLLYRYDPELVAPGMTLQTATWLAVWDPDTAELLTLAGSPAGDATPFGTNGEGPVDLDGDGNLETTITSGTRVDLVRLIDGERLATAQRCPLTVDVSVTFNGFGADPISFTVTVVGSEQSYTGETSGENGQAGPFVFELPLHRGGTYITVNTPAGPIEWEALLRAGRNVATIDATREGAEATL